MYRGREMLIKCDSANLKGRTQLEVINNKKQYLNGLSRSRL
jgi:hypothetical protein